MAFVRQREGTTIQIIPEWRSDGVTLDLGHYTSMVRLHAEEAEALANVLLEVVKDLKEYRAKVQEGMPNAISRSQGR